VSYQAPMRWLGAERYSRSRRARGVPAFAADREASGQAWNRTDQTPTVRRVPASAEVAEAPRGLGGSEGPGPPLGPDP
jgi:GntR family transcriptional regulator